MTVSQAIEAQLELSCNKGLTSDEAHREIVNGLDAAGAAELAADLARLLRYTPGLMTPAKIIAGYLEKAER